MLVLTCLLVPHEYTLRLPYDCGQALKRASAQLGESEAMQGTDLSILFLCLIEICHHLHAGIKSMFSNLSTSRCEFFIRKLSFLLKLFSILIKAFLYITIDYIKYFNLLHQPYWIKYFITTHCFLFCFLIPIPLIRSEPCITDGKIVNHIWLQLIKFHCKPGEAIIQLIIRRHCA